MYSTAQHDGKPREEISIVSLRIPLLVLFNGQQKHLGKIKWEEKMRQVEMDYKIVKTIVFMLHSDLCQAFFLDF